VIALRQLQKWLVAEPKNSFAEHIRLMQTTYPIETQNKTIQQFLTAFREPTASTPKGDAVELQHMPFANAQP
jgi:hypothetical protein